MVLFVAFDIKVVVALDLILNQNNQNYCIDVGDELLQKHINYYIL